MSRRNDIPDAPKTSRRSFLRLLGAGAATVATVGWADRHTAKTQAQTCTPFSKTDYMRDLMKDLRSQIGDKYMRQYEYYNSPEDFEYYGKKLAYEAETGKATTDCSEFISAAINRCDKKYGIILDPDHPTMWYGTYNQRGHNYADLVDIPEGFTMASINEIELHQGDMIYVTNMQALDPNDNITLNVDPQGRETNFWGEHMMMVTGHDEDGNVRIIEATADPNGDGNEKDGCVIEHLIPRHKYDDRYRIDQVRRLSTRLRDIEKTKQAECGQSL